PAGAGAVPVPPGLPAAYDALGVLDRACRVGSRRQGWRMADRSLPRHAPQGAGRVTILQPHAARWSFFNRRAPTSRRAGFLRMIDAGPAPFRWSKRAVPTAGSE